MSIDRRRVLRHSGVMTRFALTLSALLACSSAFAQAPAPRPTDLPAAGNPTAPSVDAERQRRLDELFSRLKEAPNERAARLIEREIAIFQNRSGSDTADLLHARGVQAFERQDLDLSLVMFDAMCDLYPEFTEAFAKRATVYLMRREYGRAVADLETVLSREPRHFTALAALGTVFQQLGDEKNALAAFKRAIEINPLMERVPDIIRRLSPNVEGRDI